MKNILRCMVFVVVAFCATSAWAASSQTINVNAIVPTMTGGMSVSLSKITGEAADGTGGVWSTVPLSSGNNFGTLVWNTVNSIFLPNSYYAVDISVLDNTATAWTLTHTRASLASGTNNLNSKVNVSFNKQTDATHGTLLSGGYVSFNNSNSKAYTKAALAGGWLRIYYGIATGNLAKPDAAGVTPIGLDTPAGTYTGSVTITLTP